MNSDKHFSARIVDRREVAEDLFILHVEPADHSTSLPGSMQRWEWKSKEKE